MTIQLLVQADQHPLRLIAFGVFIAVVLVMLALDLGVFHRKAHEIRFREAAVWSIVWIALSLGFNAAIYPLYESHALGLGLDVPVLGTSGETRTVSGAEAVKMFFAAYLLEKSLSMDNVFIMAVIFTSLGIPAVYQHRVLFWGILGALIMRGLMIAIGVAMVQRFDWISYIFGGLLILTAGKMAFTQHEAKDPAASLAMRIFRRVLPFTDRLDGQRFLTRVNGRLVATPLFACLLLIEFTDLVFAVDSIPAVFAITADPFIVFTSNIMAILGLRALYFCLASMIARFRYLKPALVAVLMFAGIKMCLVHTPLKIPLDVSMLVVVGVLAIGIGASIYVARRSRQDPAELPGEGTPTFDPHVGP